MLFGGSNGSYLVDTWELPSYAAPVADAGPSRTINVGTLVRLDGSGSGADAGLTLTKYVWTRAGGNGPTISIASSNTPTATFTPTTFGTYAFALSVTDSREVTSTATVVIAVDAVPTVSADAGTSVALTASATDVDGDPLTYLWSRAGGTGPSVALTSATSSIASFSSPVPGTYTFAVTVSDGRAGVCSSTVTLTLTNNPPTVALSPRLVGTASGAVTLSLTAAASDSDGDSLTYEWSSPSTPPAIISSPGQAQPSVMLPSASASYIVSLTVSDGHGGAATARTTLTVRA
ncbi:MAG: PKD domain-containing protein [Candidatus Wallbacteria bacterium]|nr:PKD domain-containing protein [Candidatus Wallbacteria bacterium]